VVIAARPDAETVQWMLAHRSPSAPAIALLVDDDPGPPSTEADPASRAKPESAHAASAHAVFARAGWVVAQVPVFATPEQAWLAVSGIDAQVVPGWAVPRG
jgi:hypothetical protein